MSLTKSGVSVQAKLRRGNRVQTAWIRKKAGVKVGNSVEIFGGGTSEMWEIVELHGEMEGRRLSEKQDADRQFGPSLKKKKRPL